MPNSPKSAPSRFLLDENIPRSVRRLLESQGFSAKYDEKGSKNSKLLSIAKQAGMGLISRDKDFLKTSLFPPKEYSGIIVFRIHPPTAEKLVKALSLLLADVKEFKGRLFVVREEGFEIVD